MHCIIVRRGDYQQYDQLYRAFGDRLPVLWDRRRPDGHGDSATKREPERRQAPPISWVALGFVVVDRPNTPSAGVSAPPANASA
jgi:hypothetical protein